MYPLDSMASKSVHRSDKVVSIKKAISQHYISLTLQSSFKTSYLSLAALVIRFDRRPEVPSVADFKNSDENHSLTRYSSFRYLSYLFHLPALRLLFSLSSNLYRIHVLYQTLATDM